MSSPGGAPARLGLALGMALSASLFTSLAGAFLILRTDAEPPWRLPDPSLHLYLGAVGVTVLAIGSLMLETARSSRRRGDLMGLRATLLNTCAKGVAFLLLTAFSWYLLTGAGFGAGSSTFAALYYLCSGLLLVHVLGALALVVPVAVGRRPADPDALKNAALFWHYTTAVAALLLALLYL